MMQVIWDERKRLANMAKHSFDFADVGELNWDRALIEFARSDAFGRQRLKAIGHFRDGTAVVIFAAVGTEAISIISFRAANTRERRRLQWQKP
jgi:uncharacterized DUF497 family protein